MKRGKSMLSVLLTAAMMCTLFTGCGQDGESGGGQAADQKGSQASEGKESPAAESEGEQDSAAEDGQDTAQAGEDSGTEGEAAEGGSSGAGEGSEEFGRISEDTITLTLGARYVAGEYTTDFASTDQFQEYEKRLGIRFDVSAYDLEQWPSKLTLMMASDEMPDIIAYANMTCIDVEK